MAEYFLIAETSAVTLTIAGVVKEVVTIVVSINIFLLGKGCKMCSIIFESIIVYLGTVSLTNCVPRRRLQFQSTVRSTFLFML
jgi:hypothetical protein